MGELNFRQPPLWKIWANPIFVRYARSRLRLAPLLSWAIVTLVATSFVFFLIYLADLSRGQGRTAAANDAFVPVLIIQMVLLMLMGTGSVASGVSREADDGMTPYLRLTPMSPLAKIIGYLFGLPIREYVLFACTLPFTVFAIATGSIGMDRALDIYLILFLSAILYHLTGCVAGTVVSNRRFAGRLAQILVVFLYFVLPNLSQLGFVFFEYLTLRPVMFEELRGVHMPAFGRLFQQVSSIPAVSFFDFEFSSRGFTLLIQASLIFTFVVILYRKWRQETHHLLGKNFCLLLYSWILLLLVGNAVPMLTTSPEFFPPFWLRIHGKVDPRSAYLVAALFGLGVLLLAFAFVSIITPSSEEHTKGLRRARKLGQKRIPRRADGASATGYAFLIALIGAMFWSFFLRKVSTSPVVAINRAPHDADLLQALPIAIALYIVCYHAVLERFGRRALLMFALFFWIVPVLGSVIMAAAQIDRLPILLGGISAFTSPFYLLTLPVKNSGPPELRLMQAAVLFSLFAHFIVAAFLAWGLRRHKWRIRKRVAGSQAPNHAGES